jgi:hypothetical protein
MTNLSLQTLAMITLAPWRINKKEIDSVYYRQVYVTKKNMIVPVINFLKTGAIILGEELL